MAVSRSQVMAVAASGKLTCDVLKKLIERCLSLASLKGTGQITHRMPRRKTHPRCIIHYRPLRRMRLLPQTARTLLERGDFGFGEAELTIGHAEIFFGAIWSNNSVNFSAAALKSSYAMPWFLWSSTASIPGTH